MISSQAVIFTLKISSVIFTVWKYKLLWHHIMNRMQHPRFERNMLKKHGKCNNKQKVQFLMLNMEFILLLRQNLKNIFIFCLTSERNFVFNIKPLNILYIFLQIFFHTVEISMDWHIMLCIYIKQHLINV